MDFNLTEEQAMIRDMVRKFAENEIKPIAAEIDRDQRFPTETVEQMKELGLMGLSIPEEYGGSGGDLVSYAVACEELARVCASHSAILSVHITGIKSILYFGNEDQKKKYIPAMASGEKIGCFALTEPGAGTDAAAQKSRGVRQGDKFILNGSKVFITNGPVGGTYCIYVMTNPEKKLKGITGFIVDRNTPGFSIGRHEDKMGIRGSSTSEIFFEDMEIPVENMIGNEGEGFKYAMQVLDTGRIGMAAQAVGIAQGALEAAISYVKERIQFGKPISANQGIQWMIADMATKVEVARQMTYRAASLYDQGQRVTVPAAMAKLVAARAAMDVTTMSLQLHGGVGYTKEFPVERFMRDAKITEIYEGTNEVMKMVISGNALA
ncbi:MAG: acyl-CoA dehydrogenase [Rhodospirillaceae bacterium]|nr:acyl-CoA dehydrogenase [Rhodospirillaceae bacterium]